MRIRTGTLLSACLVVVFVGGCGGEFVQSPVEPPAPSSTSTIEPESSTTSVPVRDPDAPVEATVVRMVDGDTMEVALEPDGATAKVRLLAIDTPERGRCGFAEATDYAELLAPDGARVRLEIDPGQNADQSFGRLLRYVKVIPEDAPEFDFSIAMAREGWALVAEDFPVGLTPETRDAQGLAQSDGKGVWALCAA